MHLRPLAPLGALMLAATSGAAQTTLPDTAPIPRALAIALIGESMWSNGRIVVGRVPDGFPRDLVPADAPVLGGMEGGPVPRLVVAVPPGVGDLIDWGGVIATRAGYSAPPPERSMMARGGFVAPERTSRRAFFCRGRDIFTVLPASGARGERLANLIYESNVTHRGCDRFAEDDRRAAMMVAERVLPTLVLPPGVVMSGGGGSCGGGDAQSTHVRVNASGTPAELLEVFARQLREKGWSLGAPLSNAVFAAVSGEQREPDGTLVTTLLTVSIVPGSGERELGLRVARPTRR